MSLAVENLWHCRPDIIDQFGQVDVRINAGKNKGPLPKMLKGPAANRTQCPTLTTDS